jgi:predicted dehydrogenase
MSANSQSLSVLIVGCGNIAGGFDCNRLSDALPFTHAGAYRRHGGFVLAACVEPDEAKRTAFMGEWLVPLGFAGLADVAATGIHFDVISICSPTPCHAEDLSLALEMHPRLVFCEKPVTPSVAQTATLVARSDELGVSLAVNHNRRWDPALATLREELQTGRRGSLRSVVGFYNKGVLNNGSHMFDLLHYLLGDLTVVAAGQAMQDYTADDPTVPLWLTTSDGVPVFLACGDARDYALFELQLVFSGGIVAIEEGGQRWRERRAEESAIFRGYRTLDAGQLLPGADDASMLTAVDNIYRHLAHGDMLASTGRTALAAQRLCEQARSMAQLQQSSDSTTRTT